MLKVYKALKVAIAVSLMWGNVVLVGCAQEEFLAAEETVEAVDSDPDRVSVESALATLARFHSDDPSTRADEVPVVAHVDVLMRGDVAPITRSAAEDAPLCYIAQFEGGGYAILGADVKQGGVIAYIPNGTLTASELAEAKAAADRGEDYETPTYIHACVVAYLEAAAEGVIEHTKADNEEEKKLTRSIPFPDGGGAFDPDAPVQLMNTTWHQDAPFNNNCPIIFGRRAKVGCVALALGQILAYNKKMYNVGPDKIVPKNGLVTADNTYYPQWPIITRAIETATPAGNCQFQIANYLYAIGRAVDMNYGVDLSVAPVDNAVAFLKEKAGYKNVNLRSANIEDIKTQIKINKVPVYASGLAQRDIPELSVSNGGPHSWVIDGWQLKTIWVPVGGGAIGDYAKKVDYIYCRFGYNGTMDGWFQYNAIAVPQSYDYRLLNIIYYTL